MLRQGLRRGRHAWAIKIAERNQYARLMAMGASAFFVINISRGCVIEMGTSGTDIPPGARIVCRCAR